MKKTVLIGITCLSCACAHTAAKQTSSTSPKNINSAKVSLNPLNNSSVRGNLIMTKLDDGGVQLMGQIEGLEPHSLHGIHVHQFADCTSVDGSSAGPHFNPTIKPHGDVNSPNSHLGDLGNVQADAKGNAKVIIVRHDADFNSDRSFLNHSIIIHKASDDLHSQPSGNSGDRIACGVIVEN